MKRLWKIIATLCALFCVVFVAACNLPFDYGSTESDKESSIEQTIFIDDSVKKPINDEPETEIEEPVNDEPETESIDSIFANNSWETIASVFKSGKAADYWHLGDTKEVELGDGYTYEVQIVDMTPNRYALSDGSGYSNGVLQFVDCLAESRQMNTTDTNVGGFEDSALRAELNTTVFSQLPDDLQAVISEVSVVSVVSGIGDYTTSGIIDSENKLFLASEYEMFGETTLSIGTEEGLPQYGYWALHNINSDRVKTQINSTSATSWWLRSPHSGGSATFCAVGRGGYAGNHKASSLGGVCPCFAF